MTSRKIIGYIFIVLSILLALAIVGQLPALFKTIFGIFRIIKGSTDSYDTGYVIGSFIYWVIHFTLTIILWMSGRGRMRTDR